MKIPDKLFHPARSVRAKVSPLDGPLTNLSLPYRIMAALIAAICICVELTMIVLGVRNDKWLLVLLGPFGVWSGYEYVRVALEGWLPNGRLSLNPWGK